MKHTAFPALYPDPHNIGQRRLAEIQIELSNDVMRENHLEAFTTAYVNPLWRAMRRRLFFGARTDHDRAKSVLAYLETVS